ncbi:transposase [Streptomyces sp. SAI-126]|nr:transposase [Streptomyces sp. SAI-119]
MGVRPSPAASAGTGAAGVRRPDGPQRHHLEVPHGHGLAGRAGAVRIVGHFAHPLPPVGQGRHLRTDAPGSPSAGGCGRRDRLAGIGRLHRRPSPPARGRGTKRGLRDPALGRSRGGLTSKIHLVCDAVGRPIAFVVTGGNTNDCTQFTTLVEAIRVPRIGPGRPRVQPDRILGDKSYGSKAIRADRPDPKPGPAWQPRRTSSDVRPRGLQAAQCCRTCFNRLKQWRGIATRYDKTAESYQAAVTLASLLMWA